MNMPLKNQFLFKTQYTLNWTDEIVVDYFCGGGGAATGLEEGLKQAVYAAVNHNPKAIAMHALNHPHAIHYAQDVYHVDPIKLVAGRRVGWFHASPDCTHHSQASGGQPRDKQTRDLSWVVCKFAGKVQPRVISLENVKQILQWGPLIAKRCKVTGRVVTLDRLIVNGKTVNRVAEPGECVPRNNQFLVPDPKRKGKTWRHFVRSLESMGYVVEWRVLKACDYGAPTSRERLFMVARCDGLSIVWPEPTHFKNPKRGQMKWPSAAECIDFTDRGKSIFGRPKDLAEATMRRIAVGIKKRVLDNPDRYIVDENALFLAGAGGPKYSAKPTPVDSPLGTVCSTSHKALVSAKLAPCIGRDFRTGVSQSVTEPLPTTTSAYGGHSSLITSVLAPFMTECANTSNQRNMPIDEPLPTICAKVKGGHQAIVSPVLIQAGHGQGSTSNPRWGEGHSDVTKPLGTITASGGGGSSIASPILVQVGYGERKGQTPRVLNILRPLGTVVGSVKHAIVSPILVKMRFNSDGGNLTDPLPTITSGGNSKRPAGAPHAMAVASAYLMQANGGFNVTDGRELTEPMSTITNTGSQQQLVSAVFTEAFYGHKTKCDGRSADIQEPLRTVTTENRHGIVSATLSQENLDGALRVAAFLINYYGNGDALDINEPLDTITTRDRLALVTVMIKGKPWVIVDIHLRMLQPKELYKAQGFPDGYVFDRGSDGKPLSKADQVHMVGNSVSPPPMAAIARANNPFVMAWRESA